MVVVILAAVRRPTKIESSQGERHAKILAVRQPLTNLLATAIRCAVYWVREMSQIVHWVVAALL
jgi:hypothetical protein